MDTDELRIVDNAEGGRYEARLGDEIAGIAVYRQAGPRRIFLHTEVSPEHEGKGIGSRLARGALDDVRARGFTVTAICPFFAAYLERHREYADLVAAAGASG